VRLHLPTFYRLACALIPIELPQVRTALVPFFERIATTFLPAPAPAPAAPATQAPPSA